MENTDIGITRDSYREGYNLIGFDVDPTNHLTLDILVCLNKVIQN